MFKFCAFRNIPEFCSVLKDLPSLEDFGSGSRSGSGSSTPTNGKVRETRTKNSSFSQTTDGPIMTEELRKVLVALNQELEADKKRANSKSDCSRRVISPEALFLVIWKVVPRFRGYQQQVCTVKLGHNEQNCSHFFGPKRKVYSRNPHGYIELTAKTNICLWPCRVGYIYCLIALFYREVLFHSYGDIFTYFFHIQCCPTMSNRSYFIDRIYDKYIKGN